MQHCNNNVPHFIMFSVRQCHKIYGKWAKNVAERPKSDLSHNETWIIDSALNPKTLLLQKLERVDLCT